MKTNVNNENLVNNSNQTQPEKTNNQTSIRMKIDLINEWLDSDRTTNWETLTRIYINDFWNGYYYKNSYDDCSLLDGFRNDREYIFETINGEFWNNIFEINSKQVVTEMEKEWGLNDKWTDDQWNEISEYETDSFLMETYTISLSDFYYDNWELLIDSQIEQKIEDITNLFDKNGFNEVEPFDEDEDYYYNQSILGGYERDEFSICVSFDEEEFSFYYNNKFKLYKICYKYESYDEDNEWEGEIYKEISMDELPEILKILKVRVNDSN